MVNSLAVTRKVRAYLKALSPDACNMLVRALEADSRRGNTDPKFNIILKAARSLLREGGTTLPRKDLLRREFFAPGAHYLRDGPLPPKHKGIIARASLLSIWTWCCRDVSPDLFAAAEDEVNAIEDLDDQTLQRIGTALRNQVSVTLRSHLDAIWQSVKARQRLAAQLGGERVLEDAVDLIEIFEKQDILSDLRKHIPLVTRLEDVRDDHNIAEAISAFVASRPDDGVWAAATLAGSGQTPKVLIGILQPLIESDDAKLIWNSPYRVFVDLYLYEIERQIVLLREQLEVRSDAQSSVATIDRYHDLMRYIHVEIDFDEGSGWQPKLNDLVRQMSAAVSGELENVAGLLRRALKIRSGRDGGSTGIDDNAVDDAARGLLHLVAASRSTDSLAINELIARCTRETEQTLDLLTKTAFDDFLGCDDEDRMQRLQVVNAAIRLSAIMFGDDYAAHLQRSRDNALNPKSAKAHSGN